MASVLDPDTLNWSYNCRTDSGSRSGFETTPDCKEIVVLNLQKAVLICCLFLCASTVFAQDSSEVVFTDVPKAFSKITPDGKGDLQAMQQHLRKIVPELKECTVHLQIGRAQGSGVLVSADGLIMTAAHVSGRPAKRVIVTMQDGNEYVGQTLGRNTTLDASLIQLESDRTDWPHCQLGDSEKVNLGDWCITLGHPGGLEEERGVVLRLGRSFSKVVGYSKRIASWWVVTRGDHCSIWLDASSESTLRFRRAPTRTSMCL